MIKIRILTKCEECDGGYLPVGEALRFSWQNLYTLCPLLEL